MSIGEPTPSNRDIRQTCAGAPAGVNQGQVLYWGMDRFEFGQEAEAFGDIKPNTEEIDHEASLTNGWALLDDDHVMSQSLQASGDRQSGDPCPADYDFHRALCGTMIQSL